MTAWRIANAGVAVGGLMNPLVGIIGGALLFLAKPKVESAEEKTYKAISQSLQVMRATVRREGQAKAMSAMSGIMSELNWMPAMLRAAPVGGTNQKQTELGYFLTLQLAFAQAKTEMVGRAPGALLPDPSRVCAELWEKDKYKTSPFTA